MFVVRNKQGQGLALIEMMIALCIGLIIITTLFQIYIANNRASQLQHEINTIEKKGTFAIQFLSNEIKKSGYIGCRQKIYNNDYYNQSLTVSYAGFHDALLLSVKDNVLSVSEDTLYKKNDILILHDCQHYETFGVGEVEYKNHVQCIKPSHNLNYSYDKYAEINYLVRNKFYISKTNYKYKNGEFINALYFEDVNRVKREIVSGIKEMRFKYFIDTKNKIQIMDTADDATKVRGIEISLLIETENLKKYWYAVVALT